MSLYAGDYGEPKRFPGFIDRTDGYVVDAFKPYTVVFESNDIWLTRDCDGDYEVFKKKEFLSLGDTITLFGWTYKTSEVRELLKQIKPIR